MAKERNLIHTVTCFFRTGRKIVAGNRHSSSNALWNYLVHCLEYHKHLTRPSLYAALILCCFSIFAAEKNILPVLRLSSHIGLAFFSRGEGVSIFQSLVERSCLIVPEIYAIFLPLYNNNSVYRTDMLEDDAHTGAWERSSPLSI